MQCGLLDEIKELNKYNFAQQSKKQTSAPDQADQFCIFENDAVLGGSVGFPYDPNQAELGPNGPSLAIAQLREPVKDDGEPQINAPENENPDNV